MNRLFFSDQIMQPALFFTWLYHVRCSVLENDRSSPAKHRPRRRKQVSVRGHVLPSQRQNHAGWDPLRAPKLSHNGLGHPKSHKKVDGRSNFSGVSERNLLNTIVVVLAGDVPCSSVGCRWEVRYRVERPWNESWKQHKTMRMWECGCMFLLY